ncbi:nitroreductase [Streptomyces sp. NPDC002602]|uniref:nitroreductase family protein n=1 Tax=Streptomyces sp. NPDC002602 TaxID=3364654 RepID=UPI0036C92501
MDVMTAVMTRRSTHRLTTPPPSDEEFSYFLRSAALAPDHGVLRPWRWITVRGEDRHTLGASFATTAAPENRAKTAAKAMRAPLLATLVFTPRPNPKVPEWEQPAATSAMSHSLMMLLHSRGFGSIWRTGPLIEDVGVRETLGLDSTERLLGWLYIGTPESRSAPRRRELTDVADRLTTFAGMGAGAHSARM